MWLIPYVTVTGHMFVYPLVIDLLAQTDSERARALRLLNATVGYISANGYYLIDVTGQPTRHVVIHLRVCPGLHIPVLLRVCACLSVCTGGATGRRRI